MARPKLPWRSPLLFYPSIGPDVWVRRTPWYDTPILTGWDGDNFYIIPAAPPTTPTQYPEVYLSPTLVHSWKYRYLADEQAAFPPE